MSQRMTIYAPELVTRYMDSHGVGPGYRSGTLASVLERYEGLCRAHLPRLPESWWRQILRALEGAWTVKPAAEVIEQLDLILAGRLRTDDGRGNPPLAAAVQSMTYAERVAVLDAAERWWADACPGDLREYLGDDHVDE